TELRQRGVKLGPAGVELRVTLAENVREHVWTAELRQEVAIASFPRGDETIAAPALLLERRLMWEQSRPILDLAETSGRTVVLEPERIVVYQGREVARTIPVEGAELRDPRGTLRIAGEEIAAEVFPRARRNVLGSLDGKPYYSTAALGDVRIWAGVDGVTRTSAGESWTGWGSDITAVESACGVLVLATRASGGEEADAVGAYRIASGRPEPMGEPVEFAGPVTALWPRGGGALVVARNRTTGRYAAYSLRVACPR
ncbi:MAG: hypothetical protein ACRD96_26310, partial [Bryobacteraceae bacterium]